MATALFLLFFPVSVLAASVVLKEDFGANDACQIPVDWEIQDLLAHSAGSCGWKWRLNQIDENNMGTGTDDDEGCFVLANSDECGLETNVDTVLVTRTIDCTDLSGTSLTFKYDAYKQWESSTFAVEVSVNSGEWVDKWQRTENDRGPKTATVDLSAEADGQSSVRIRFRYTASSDWWWQIDDVTVSANVQRPRFIPAINFLLFSSR
jgi:hypothetical protein